MFLKVLSLSFLISLLILFILPSPAIAISWHFPMNSYYERQYLKDFTQLIDDKFYVDKEDLFPFNRFYGYHAGVDLEIFPDEERKNVSVFSIYDGVVSFVGSLAGYGGVILIKLDNTNHTVLYGHVKIKNLNYKTGDRILSGKLLTSLGDAFSEETSKERKHLHFAIYKGGDLYFRGHEKDLTALNNKWENPNNFLKGKLALSPEEQVFSSLSPTMRQPLTASKANNFLLALISRIINFFSRLFSLNTL